MVRKFLDSSSGYLFNQSQALELAAPPANAKAPQNLPSLTVSLALEVMASAGFPPP